MFIGGPLAFYVADLIRRGGGQPGAGGGRTSAKLWFWGSMLACGELYGGFMVCLSLYLSWGYGLFAKIWFYTQTFAPEWLSGNANLDTDSFMKL